MQTAELLEDDPAERKSRHLGLARELQEMAMRLTRNACEKAAAQLEAPDPEPGEPRAHDRAPDHALTFTRLARVVQFAMVLEVRAATDTLIRRPRPYVAPTPAASATPDPRRPLLREALHHALKSGPETTAAQRNYRRREIDDGIEQALQADPDQTKETLELLGAIADHYNVHINPKEVSDELLGICPSKHRYPDPGRRENL